jgi:hypothetical protein
MGLVKNQVYIDEEVNFRKPGLLQVYSRQYTCLYAYRFFNYLPTCKCLQVLSKTLPIVVVVPLRLMIYALFSVMSSIEESCRASPFFFFDGG